MWLYLVHRAVAQAQEGTFLGTRGLRVSRLLCAGRWSGGLEV